MAADAHTPGAPDCALKTTLTTVYDLISTLHRLEAILFVSDHAVDRLDRYQPVDDPERRAVGRISSLVDVCSELVEQARTKADAVECAVLGAQREGC